MNSFEFEITIQRKYENSWPVIITIRQPNDGLRDHAEGNFQLTPEQFDKLEKLKIKLPPHRKEYGTLLGKALFQDKVLKYFETTFTKSQEREVSFRLLLSITADDDELRTLHWEWLCAPINGSWRLVSRSQRILFSQYIPTIIDRRFPSIGRRSLRVLILVASPSNLEKDYELANFDVKHTISGLKNVLGNIDCDVLAHDVEGAIGLPTLNELIKQLTNAQKPYTLLHIVCHGSWNEEDKDTVLYWATAENQVKRVTGEQLIDRLQDITQGLPHFTFFCACESAVPTTNSKVKAEFGGLAQSLVRELGMPAVVGMTREVSIETALKLAENFYQRLREHGEVDKALREAIAELADEEDITVPALFSRLGGRPLFSDRLEGRELNDEEIEDGTEVLETLLKERAPEALVLWNRFKQHKEMLTQIKGLESRDASSKRKQALDELNNLCDQLLDGISFDALAALAKEPPEYNAKCPFPGLSSFRDEEYHEFFCGRDKLIEDLEKKLENDNFVAVIGPSGSGKSSVVLAGLIPKLCKEKSLKMEYLTPTDEPLQQLQKSVSPVLNQPAVFVVDQFEELFTLCSKKGERKKFIKELLELAQNQKVIITMRADFMGECISADPKLKKRIEERQILVAPMEPNELGVAMKLQADKAGLKFEDGLSNAILSEVEGEPGAMPLLQYALRELWERRQGRWLRYEEYEAIGGLKKAIAKTADDFYNDKQLSNKDKELVKNIFIRLTHLDENTLQDAPRRDTRQRVELDVLIPNEKKRERTREIVKLLADKRLVITSGDKQTEKIWVELAHEALIRHWPRLQTWLEEDREKYILRQKIAQARADWENSKDQGNLLRGQRLEDAIKLLDTPDFLDKNEREYIEASRDERDRINQEKIEASLDIGITSSQLLFVSNKRLDAIVNLIKTGKLLQKEQKIAEHTKIWFLVIFNQLLSDVAEYNSVNAHNDLITSISCSPDNKTIASSCMDGTIKFWNWDGTCISEERINDAIWDIAFNPDGEIVASAGNSGTIKLWHTNRQNSNRWEYFKTIEAHQYPVYSISFNLKDKTFASAGEDGNIKLWNTDGSPIKSLEVKSLEIPISAILHIAFSPDGQKLASAHKNGNIIIWDLKYNNHIPIVNEHKREVLAVSFNHDSTNLIAGSADKTITLWNTNGGLKEVFRNYEEEVRHVAFSLNDEIVAAYRDGTIVLLSNDCRRKLRTLKGHIQEVPKFNFGSNSEQDSNKMVSCSADKTIKFWCWNGKFEGHSNDIKQIDFSPDGQLIATASTDGTAKLWKLDGKCQQTLCCYDSKDIYDVKFSPHGKVIATAGADGIIQLWTSDQNQWKPYITFKGHTGIVNSLSFSPVGNKIATTGLDSTIKLWNLKGKPLRNIIDKNPEVIQMLAFSSEGSMLASATNKTVKLWDCNTGNLIQVFSGFGNFISCFCFSQDGMMIAIVERIISNTTVNTSIVCKISIWNLNSQITSSQPIQVFISNSKDYIQGVKFSQDNKTIVSIAENGVMELWGLDGKQLKNFQIHDQKIEIVSFSHDWSSIAVVDSENRINLWNLNMEKTIKRACQQIDEYLTLNKLELC